MPLFFIIIIILNGIFFETTVNPSDCFPLYQGDNNASSIRKKRETVEVSLDYVSDDLLKQTDTDIAAVLSLLGGITSSDVFDTSIDASVVCSVCVWVQPNFAEKFGFRKGYAHGVAEVIEMLRLLDWLYRAIDFNGDGVAENVGFKIKSVTASNMLEVKIRPELLDAIRKKSRAFNQQTQKRKRRALVEDIQEEDFDYYDLLFADPDEELPAIYKDFAETYSRNGSRKGAKIPGEYLDASEWLEVDDFPGSTIDMGHAIYSLNPKEAYYSLLGQVQGNSRFSGCCAVVAFVYHNLAPSLSAATQRGLCSKMNLAVVSGLLHMHKVGKYDVVRALMHAFGHMMGASHDKTMKDKCQDKKPSRFLNPFIMHPVQQINIGLRPNSFRLSPCAKMEMSSFLNSPNVQCLQKEPGNFCGNAEYLYESIHHKNPCMVDPGEECDCGSPWQCHEFDCCGERDTIFGCKIINFDRGKDCPRPHKW